MDFYLNLFIIIADQFMLFIINMIVARHAGEELFGDFSVATSALLLIATVITFGIDSIIAYYIPKFYVRKKYDEIGNLTASLKNFLHPIYTTLITSGVLLSVAIVALSYMISDIDLFEISHPLFLFLWGAVALSLYNIFIQFFRAINHMRTAILLSLLQTIFYFSLSLITYFYLYPVLFHENKHYFPHVMLISFIISYVLIVLISVALERKTTIQRLYRECPITGKTQIEWKEKMYGYMVQNLNKYVFAAIPLLMIEWLGPNEESVGLFSAVVSIISLAFIAISPIGILIGPDISAAFAQSRDFLKTTMMRYLLMTFGISLILVTIIAVCASHILLLYKSDFIRALPYTYFCLINIITYSISMPLSKMIQYSKNGNKIGARLTASMMLLQIVSCFIFIPWLDLHGAIICYVGINLVYNVVMIVMAIRIYRYDPFGHEAI
ncbi:lipopolysaccharide biosynthesis protein [Legionella maceachernii]|uniref:Polysaccharide biosynthesis protein n=1 Tax=Legionella maceachernii TaxID=466 RepID=A0A0W0WGT2_9GAMM|nr:oligosaccharide flippase family protein [Legionella maceachernii]KTD31572.1 Polysaccharide biosynthesis protein [Legionella maceachernii]SKA11386.1 Polysaccharide biosynthesis protein [Legionella maceachernii]SUO99603.1 Polysaccharide biosynthesis protein [Legionella maceachernii]